MDMEEELLRLRCCIRRYQGRDCVPLLFVVVVATTRPHTHTSCCYCICMRFSVLVAKTHAFISYEL
jgi:hypothetical protein